MIALPAVSHHMISGGFKAEVITPADTGPDANSFSLEDATISIAATFFALFISTIAKSIIITPPIMDIYDMIVSPKKDAAPARMSRKITNSTSACPKNTDGPVLHPFFIEMPMVANIMGPGMRAADMPTVNPRIRACINSIMFITD